VAKESNQVRRVGIADLLRESRQGGGDGARMVGLTVWSSPKMTPECGRWSAAQERSKSGIVL